MDTQTSVLTGWRKTVAHAMLSIFVITQVLSNPAIANSFTDGQNMGNNTKGAISSGISSGSFLDKMPSFGTSGNADPSNLQGNYPRKGRDDPSSITNLMTAGSDLKNNNSCQEDDTACKARSFVNERYNSAKPNFKDTAKDMLAKSNLLNPEDVLGLNNMPTEGGSSVCVETTTNMPDGTENKTCLDATLKQTTLFSKLPITTNKEYTSPYCVDPNYILSGDKSRCEKLTYSCPTGGTLQGGMCVKETQVSINKCSSPGKSLLHSTDFISTTVTCESDTSVHMHVVSWGTTTGSFPNEFRAYAINQYTNQKVSHVARVVGDITIPANNKQIYWDGDEQPQNPYPENEYIYIFHAGLGIAVGLAKYSELLAGGTVYLYSVDIRGNYNIVSGEPHYVAKTDFDITFSGGTTTYPATQDYKTATPGCMGGTIVRDGQLIQTSPSLVNGGQSGGSKTCEYEVYSCPAGMAMNGSLCEDVNRMQFVNDPLCVNLGYIPTSQIEGFLCTTQELRECKTMPESCVQTDSRCIYHDEIRNSPDYGRCIATVKTFDCPVIGQSYIAETCSFKPMCIDGNCFEQEDKCPAIPGANPVQHYNEVCQSLTKETIETCPVTYVYGQPDHAGVKHIIRAEVNASSCQWENKSNCRAAPIRMITDSSGNAKWPTVANYSCLGDTMDFCQEFDNDAQCTLKSQKTEQTSIDGSRPVTISKHFDCARTLTVATDSCTDDFAKMAVAMEASRQAGEYFDIDNIKIFGGEFHRCDVKVAALFGGKVDSKSCCNISAPDPKHNSDVLSEVKTSIMMQGAKSLVDYAVDSGSSYIYDYMMNSETYQAISSKLLGSAVEAATAASQADMLAEQTAEFDNAGIGISYAGFGIAYVGGGAAAGTVVAGGATGTSSFALGGGFQLQFSPVGFYLYAAMELYKAYQAALACDEEDYKTATLTKGKLCYSYGTWCEKKTSGVFGNTCEKYRTGKCCFNSKLARIINEQGRKQLNLSMNSCQGFSIDELERLDWSKIDLTEFISDMLDQAQRNLPTAHDLQRLNNKVINNIGASTTAGDGKQPIDLGVDGEKRKHH